jgi:abhydrolase domain-containing protein 12
MPESGGSGSILTTSILCAIGGLMLPYAAIGLFLSIPALERRAIYMYKSKTSPKHYLEDPKKLGFEQGQVLPFRIITHDNVALHAWHILPLGLHERHREALSQEGQRESKLQDTLSFRLLRDDPEARLIIYTHGSSGDIASSWRVDSYRTLSSEVPGNTHVLSFDYRGFGLSEGTPNEQGLIMDAESVFDWAVNNAGVSPDRIVIFGHSMGVGVSIALVQRLLSRNLQVAGLVTVAGFVDVASIAKSRRIVGLPIFKPLQLIPGLLGFLFSKLESTWENGKRLTEIVSQNKRVHIEIVHARDDKVVPYCHADALFLHALRGYGGSVDLISEDQYDSEEPCTVKSVRTDKGSITLSIPLLGDHDKVISRPTIVSAIVRALN